MTLNEAWDKLEKLAIDWEENTDQDSLLSVEIFQHRVDSFLDDLIYYSDFGKIPADMNNVIDILDNDVFEQWAFLKFKVGETNMPGYQTGGRH